MRKRYRILILSLLFGGIASSLFAQMNGLVGSLPLRNPVVLGQGNSTAASARGAGALFTNPAGFIHPEVFGNRDKFGLYIGAHAWGNLFFVDGNNVLGLNPAPSESTAGLLNGINDITGFFGSLGGTSSQQLSETGFFSSLLDVMKDGELSAGAATTIGYVNHGFGLGLRLGLTLDNDYSEGHLFNAMAEYAFVGGYAHTFNIGDVALTAGFDIRPFMQHRIVAPTPTSGEVANVFEELITDFINQSLPREEDLWGILFDRINFLSGWGVGVDLGLTVEYRSFTAGVQVRDIYTPFFYQTTRVDKGASDFINSYGFPVNLTDGKSGMYIIPAEISFGAMYDIPLNKENLFDMRIHFQFSDPFNLTGHFTGDSMHDFFHSFDMGVEMELLSFLDIRAGITDGALSFGTGIDLFLLEVHATIYDVSMGIPGFETNNPKIAIEAALSF